MTNLASNLMSMTLYIASGKVMYPVAVPALCMCMLGNYIGAKYAIKGGSKKIRKIMFIVLILLFVKIIFDLISSF
jgi:uncharacterized membrane protein YfcA